MGRKAIERDSIHAGAFAHSHPHRHNCAKLLLLEYIQSYIKWSFANAQHERRKKKEKKRHYYHRPCETTEVAFSLRGEKKSDVIYEPHGDHFERESSEKKKFKKKKKPAQIIFFLRGGGVKIEKTEIHFLFWGFCFRAGYYELVFV